MALQHDIFGGIERKTIKSKDKGNTNEREVCKVLKLWTGAPFVRVPGSGSLRWQDTGKIAGDVTCDQPDFFFPFSVETKHLAQVSIKGNLQANSRIYTIMEQCMFDADRSNRLPMMLLRPNGMKGWKKGKNRYQNYYLVLLHRFGGQYLWRDLGIKPLFVGKCAVRGFDITGFDLQEVISKANFESFMTWIKKNNRLMRFADKKNEWYKWEH